jgi:hypothetical protein
MEKPNIYLAFNGFIETFKKYPLSVLCSLIASIIALVAVNNNYNYSNYQNLWNAVKVIYLAVPVFTAFVFLNHRKKYGYKAQVIQTVIISAILLIYYVWMDDSMEHEIRYTTYIFISIATIFISPFLNLRKEDEFWFFGKDLIKKIFISGLFALVIFAGLSVAIWTIDKLLIKLDNFKSYTTLFIITISILNTLYFYFSIRKIKI